MKGVVELPIGIAGINGILEATVVTEDVPRLLPVKLLRDLHAVINLSTGRLELSQYQKATTMSTMRSGHVIVSIVEFDEEGWKLPTEAWRCGLKDDDFRLMPECSSRWSDDIQVFSQYRSSSFLWSRLNQILAEMEARDATSSGSMAVDVRVVKAARATQNWKKVLVKVMNLMTAFDQVVRGCPEEEEAWRGDGYVSGFAAPSAAIGLKKDSPGSTEDDEATHYINCDMHSSHPIPMWSRKPVATRSVVPECYSRWKIETMSQLKVQEEAARKNKVEPSNTPPRGVSSWSMVSPERTLPTTQLRSLPSTPSTSVVSESPGRLEQVAMKCLCQKPATRYTVKKEGPTKGRHFFRGSARVWDYFIWDQEEIQQLKTGMFPSMKEVNLEVEKMKEDASEVKMNLLKKEEELKNREVIMMEELKKKEMELQEMQAHMSENTKQMIEPTMAHADTKHRELMQGQQYQYQVQMEQLQNQLMWTMAVAGEERLSQAFSDPQWNAEMMQQAMELKKTVMQSQGMMPFTDSDKQE